jgi:hypothetical protein
MHQGGTVRRGNRAQIGGQTGYIGEQVHRPEPAGEFFRRNDALDVPGRLVDQYQLPALAVPLGTRYPLAVRTPSLYVHSLRISTWVNGELQRSG